MEQKDTPNVRHVRVPPDSRARRTDVQILREFAEYQGERRVTGTTLLEVPRLGREVHLLTLEDGEHLLLLLQGQRFCHWEGTREPFAQLRERACDWLTEPAAPNRP